MLSLDRLRALAAVAEHGSVARAARALHVTPSGVSQQLGKLEREAGHPLIERHGRSVRLTQAGQVLAAHAARVLDQVSTAEAELAALHDEIIGPLRMGAVGSALRAFLPTVIAELATRHPRLVPTVRDGEAVDLVPLLLSGDLDLLLVESWLNRPTTLPEGVSTTTLLREEVLLALSTEHPASVKERVDLAELGDIPWASCPPGTAPYESLVQLLRSRGLEPDVRYTVAEFATQLALVRTNVCAAVIPSLARSPLPSGVRLVRTDPVLRRDIWAAWRPSSDSPALRACLFALQERAEELT